MYLKKFVIFFIFCFLFVFVSSSYCDDLKIEEGKNLKFDFKGDNAWYDDTQVYQDINIGAGTKVVLGSEWQYVLVSSSTKKKLSNRDVEIEGSTQTKRVQDELYETTYEYRNDENIATLALTGTLTLNSGSELSIRNQYSLLRLHHLL